MFLQRKQEKNVIDPVKVFGHHFVGSARNLRRGYQAPYKSFLNRRAERSQRYIFEDFYSYMEASDIGALSQSR